MPTFAFYSDANLTTPSSTIAVAQNADGSSAPVQTVRYLGSTTAAKKLRNSINPGVTPISLQVVDAAAGSGHAASEVKLALTQAGLASATPGASLAIGTQILSGIANAVPIWVEVNDATHTAGFASELSIHTVDDVQEDVV